MRIVKWSGRAKTDFVDILGYLYQHWSDREAQYFIDSIRKLTGILEKGDVEFRKTNKRLHVAVASKHVSVYYQIHSSKRVEIIRVWDNRQKPSKLYKL